MDFEIYLVGVPSGLLVTTPNERELPDSIAEFTRRRLDGQDFDLFYETKIAGTGAITVINLRHVILVVQRLPVPDPDAN
jgi:hypothetical protein